MGSSSGWRISHIVLIALTLQCGGTVVDPIDTGSEEASDTSWDGGDTSHDAGDDTTLDSSSSGDADAMSETTTDVSIEVASDTTPEAADSDVLLDTTITTDTITTDTTADVPGDSSSSSDVSDGSSDTATDSFDSGGDSVLDSSDGGSTVGEIGPYCGCPTGSKHCTKGSPHCVSINDPANGCATSACTPCTLPNASAKCVGGACVVASCATGWANCDGSTTACSFDLSSDRYNCGACGKTCASTETCTDGVCATGCSPPLTVCSGSVCANLLTSLANCGGCGKTCTPGPGESATCSGGTCIKTPVACPSGLTLCGSTCVDLLNDPVHCGSCTNSCDSGSGWVASNYYACSLGVCNPCPSGTTRCALSTTYVCADLTRSASNCGSCGSTCAAGDACWGGKCVSASTFVLTTATVSDFVVDDTWIFFVDTGGGTIKKMPKAGGAVVTLASGEAKPVRIAQDATHIYWTNNLGAAVRRIAKSGVGGPMLVAAASEPGDLAVDESRVYWSNGTDQTVKSRAKDGSGTTATLYTPTVIATPPTGLQVVGSWLYFASPTVGGHTVRQIPKVGGAEVLPSADCFSSISFVADDSGYYWTCGLYLSYQNTLAGSSLTVFGSALNWGFPTGPFVLDGDRVFMLLKVGAGLPRPREARKCDLRWPAVVIDLPATMIAVDATYFYWSDGTVIGRVAK